MMMVNVKNVSIIQELKIIIKNAILINALKMISFWQMENVTHVPEILSQITSKETA